MENYSIETYIENIRSVVARETSQRTITEKIRPLAERVAANKNWIKPDYRKIDPNQGFGIHLLYEENNHDLAVFIVAWAPGRGLEPHNHKTWAVVAGIEGQEHEVNYKRLDDGSKKGFADLQKTHEQTLYPGNAVCCLPEDIHSVWNNGTELALSIHTYGKHLNYTGRSIFDVEEKTETPCIVKVQD